MAITPERRHPDKLQWVITALLGVVIALLTIGANGVNSSLSYLTKSIAEIGADVSSLKATQESDKLWRTQVDVRLNRLETNAQSSKRGK
jgi:hypothetical protein